VILLSHETELKKLLKETILNHTGVRIRWFLNVLWQTRITLWEDPLFTVREYEQEGRYYLEIFCKWVCVVKNSCIFSTENDKTDLPHQCRRDSVAQLFDFFIDADEAWISPKTTTIIPCRDIEQ
jgi:hypothetical protein